MDAFWQCCRNCKIIPQEPKHLVEKEERVSKLMRDDHLQYGGDSSQGKVVDLESKESADSSGTKDSANSSNHTLPSVESERVTVQSMYDKTIMNIMNLVKSGEKDYQNNEENISFLHAISTWCMDTLKGGQDTLGLPYTKAELTEAIVTMMESLPIHSVPSSVLSCSMLAIYNLSKLKPPYELELESCILRLSLHGVFNMETYSDNPHSQALYQSSSDTMEIMLKSLLARHPTISHLLFILEHINFWIRSRNVRERSRAIKCSTSLLQHAVFLLALDVSPTLDRPGDLPALGHHVAQLGICVTDSADDVSHYARVAISCLYELLLNQIGLRMNDSRKLWCQASETNRTILDYVDTCRVGEVFRKLFTEDQKNAYLQTAMQALYDPFLRISEAGILLVYSLLGRGRELLADEVQMTRKLIFRHLHKLRTQKVVPEPLQSLFPS